MQNWRAGKAVELCWIAALGLAIGAIAMATPLPTAKKDFFHPGSQPGSVTEALISPLQCAFCHADYDDNQAPFNHWAHSLMGQAGRDPIFHAALAIAEQDASFSADFCLRCHVPATWLRGQVQFDEDPMSANFGKHTALIGPQLEGISCSICHRMVDPVYTPGQSPSVDQAIIAAIDPGPITNPHNAGFVIDPLDRRRGPFNLDADWNAAFGFPFPEFHAWQQSAFHLSSRMCATCHDVSTPHFSRQPDGTYALNALDTAPPPDKLMQFPEQRTFSEWAASMFGQGPVDLDGRFGNLEAVASCQDCHMPKITGQGCALEPPTRSDLPQHDFNGANSWVLRAVKDLYPDGDTGLTPQGVDDAIARTVSFLERASDMELSLLSGNSLNVRIINFSGHKLPTGYTEGRRMWINVKFKDAGGSVIAERGAYDPIAAVLNETDTKVYEGKIGPDVAVGTLTGLPAGPSFHLVYANKWYKDNRIPPMGFNNAAFEALQAGHTPANQYADGQYWDDTPFLVPSGARSAEVSVFHQTTSKEYIEFLQSENTSDLRGQIAYDQWLAKGKSLPVLMDHATIPLFCPCDWDQSGTVSIQDLFSFLTAWFGGTADFNSDNVTTVQDIFDFLTCWFNSCA